MQDCGGGWVRVGLRDACIHISSAHVTPFYALKACHSTLL